MLLYMQMSAANPIPLKASVLEFGQERIQSQIFKQDFTGS